MKTNLILKTLLCTLIAGGIGLFFSPVACLAQKEPIQKPLSNAKIEFKDKQHDFGDVVQGETVTYTFTFVNTGTEPLMILNVQTTCGCTAPSWPKKPIPPGEASEIVVTFNSTKKVGRINKIITVYTNGQKPEEKLKIVANVLVPSQEPAAPEKPTTLEVK